MPKYLYIFSFQTPEQQRNRKPGDVPDESCEAVFIEAGSPEQALTWGRKLSEDYVKRLFGISDDTWSGQNFAAWIEAEPEKEYPSEVLAKVPTVSYGQYPNLQALKRA